MTSLAADHALERRDRTRVRRSTLTRRSTAGQRGSRDRDRPCVLRRRVSGTSGTAPGPAAAAGRARRARARRRRARGAPPARAARTGRGRRPGAASRRRQPAVDVVPRSCRPACSASTRPRRNAVQDAAPAPPAAAPWSAPRSRLPTSSAQSPAWEYSQSSTARSRPVWGSTRRFLPLRSPCTREAGRSPADARRWDAALHQRAQAGGRPPTQTGRGQPGLEVLEPRLQRAQVLGPVADAQVGVQPRTGPLEADAAQHRHQPRALAAEGVGRRQRQSAVEQHVGALAVDVGGDDVRRQARARRAARPPAPAAAARARAAGASPPGRSPPGAARAGTAAGRRARGSTCRRTSRLL